MDASKFDLNYILANSCSNPDTSFDPTEELDEVYKRAAGWERYRIETHCLGFLVSAQKIKEGVYNQENQEWDIVPEYEIRSVETYAC